MLLSAIIEALLFASQAPLTTDELAQLNTSADHVLENVKRLNL